MVIFYWKTSFFFLIFVKDNKIKYQQLYLFYFGSNWFENNNIITFIFIKSNKIKTFYIYKIIEIIIINENKNFIFVAF